MTAFAFVLEGLAAGAVPGLLAAGLSLVHRTTGVLSFAHGAIGAAAAYVAFVVSRLGSPDLLGAPVAALSGALLSLPLAPAVALLKRKDEAAGPLNRPTPGASILLTLGYGLLIEAGVRALFGADVKAFLHIFSEERPVLLFDGGSVPRSSLLLLTIVLGVFGATALFLGRTRVGLRLRAVGSSKKAALTLGLFVKRLERLAWVLCGATAGLSGWLLAPRLGLEPHMMWGPMVTGFVAAALGGLDRPARALLSGLLIGLSERATFLVAGPVFAPVLQWVILLAALAASRDDQ